jgi:hypothetical protein
MRVFRLGPVGKRPAKAFAIFLGPLVVTLLRIRPSLWWCRYHNCRGSRVAFIGPFVLQWWQP